MQQHTLHRAAIAPVAEEHARPLWSVMIPTFNCARYLRETLMRVLEQDPGPHRMQIEVVDDHSTLDDPAAVVAELGRGRVGFYRQPANVGYIRNFETCLNRARGHLVHLLHGDDYVMEGFYTRMRHAFQEAPGIGAAFCRHIYISPEGEQVTMSLLEREESGQLENWLEQIAAGQRIATPAIVVRRIVYEQLGGFDRRMTCAGEDWEMWVRIAANYPVWFEVEPLAAYRVKRDGALTEEAARTHRLVRDMRRATEIIESYLPAYLPAQRARALTKRARHTYAQWALEGVRQGIASNNWTTIGRQTLEAFRCSSSARILRAVARLFMQEGTRRMRRISSRVEEGWAE